MRRGGGRTSGLAAPIGEKGTRDDESGEPRLRLWALGGEKADDPPTLKSAACIRKKVVRRSACIIVGGVLDAKAGSRCNAR